MTIKINRAIKRDMGSAMVAIVHLLINYGWNAALLSFVLWLVFIKDHSAWCFLLLLLGCSNIHKEALQILRRDEPGDE